MGKPLQVWSDVTGGLGSLEEVGGVAGSGLGLPLLGSPRHCQRGEQLVPPEGLTHVYCPMCTGAHCSPGVGAVIIVQMRELRPTEFE